MYSNNTEKKVKRNLIISERLNWIFIGLAILALTVFQVNKRNEQITVRQERELALKATNNPLSKVLNQLPIFRDSIYSVYIIKDKDSNKIVFLKKGTITLKQKESNFFVHIYPKDKNALKMSINHIPNNFKNNVTKFIFRNEKYFVSQTNLPNIRISKLNLGQFGFRGDNNVSWKIPHLLIDKKIANILKQNKEDVQLFGTNEDSF